MNVLVTGGAGYIGSHAVRQLIKEHHLVVVLDNLSHGSQKAVHTGAAFVHGDVEDDYLLKKIFREFAIETVLHFAADIEVSESVADPYKYYRNNFARPLNLLKAMQE